MKLKYFTFAIGYGLFVALMAAVSLGASIPSLLEKAAPYACPAGSEPAIYSTEYQNHGGESGTEIEMLCESPVAEWDRIFTTGAVLASMFFLPIFVILLLVAFMYPSASDDSLKWIFGFVSLALLGGGLAYEQVTDPVDGKNHMFIAENLFDAMEDVEESVGGALHVDRVDIRTSRVNMTRTFPDDPKASEDIRFDDGEVIRDKKHKKHFKSRSFLVSEVPWKRIPALLLLAVDAAELDGGRISLVRVDLGWRKKNRSMEGVRIEVEVKGFEYEATVVFDREGNQVSVKKELQN